MENKRETFRAYTEEQKAVSGVVLSVSRDGEMSAEYGVVRKEDKQLAFPAKDNDISETIENSIESNALKSDLHNFKQQALQSELMKDDKLTYDLIVYSLASQYFSPYGYAAVPIDIAVSSAHVSSTNGIDETTAHNATEDFKTSLDLSWLSHETKAEQFKAFRALNTASKKRLLSFVTAKCYKLACSDDINNVVMTELAFEMAQHWTPNKDNYFNRVKKDALLTIAKERISEEWVSQHEKLPKGKLIVQMEAAKQMAGWMPQSMM